MKDKIFKLNIIGIIFVTVFGTINHFVFEWSNYNNIIALFCPVNESVWEHLKLLYFPYIIWGVIEYFILKKEKCILPSKLIGAVSGMVFIVSFYYIYIGIAKRNIDFLNIFSFVAGICFAFLIERLIRKSKKLCSKSANIIAVAGIFALGVLFFLFTYIPPFIPLFKDPQNKSYGI